MRPFAPALLAVVLTAVAPAALVAQVPAPAPEPAPAQPTATPVPPPPAATPLPVPTPAPTPSSPYHYIVTPPSPAPGQPAILEIDMLDQTLHAGGPYSVRVKTSPDVTAISVSTMGQTYGMQSAGPGVFASDGSVPGGIPFFMLNRNYDVTITAATADGRKTSTTISLRLER